MSHVYVIQAEKGPVKVGVATDPMARLAVLKTGSPFPLSIVHVLETRAVSAFAVEKAAHRILSAFHVHGEWFSACASDAVAAIKAAYAELRATPPTAPISRTRIDPALTVTVQSEAEAYGREAWDVQRGPFRDLEPIHLLQGRHLLKWSQGRLAQESGLAASTIKRLENGGLAKASVENIDRVSGALAAAGIEFFNGGEPGVRLRRVAQTAPHGRAE